ncbi:MAG: FtsX-like permease family protein [Aureispira sp.]|nr:FtsX-like permease family protein [Aureispira sp.]
MKERILFNLTLALEAIIDNKIRSFLTAFGIVFGVASVIAMLAIGTGAKQSILERMKLIGTNNIVIEKVLPEEEDLKDDSGKKTRAPYSPGLHINDFRNIEKVLSPYISLAYPEIEMSKRAVRNGVSREIKLIGTNNDYFKVGSLDLMEGSFFAKIQEDKGSPVCVIGHDIATKFFSGESALNKRIKCGNVWFTVVGVLEKTASSSTDLEDLGLRDRNQDVYIPLQTVLLRFGNRAKIDQATLMRREEEQQFPNYHQLDQLIIQVNNSKDLKAVAKVAAAIIKRRHHQVVDFEIEIPELLLQEQEKTQETFNLVLSAIAGISLLVGGIGIMNIMLASILERIKEIGIRRSLGATRFDIITQFLFESVFISLLGGLVGIILGFVIAGVIGSYSDIPTIVSLWSILLSFGVSFFVGIVFGLFPARKAAIQDPIKALRLD